MSHTHEWVLWQAAYETYEVGPRHALSMDEVDVFVRGKQFWACECGETKTEIVTGLEPGTEPQPDQNPPMDVVGFPL